MVLKNEENLPNHKHNGIDAYNIDFDDLIDRKLYISWTLLGISAATAANYGVLFISPVEGSITSVKEVHQALGTDAGAVTLDIEKLTGTEALGAGADVLSSGIDLKDTINTVVEGTLSDSLSDKQIAIGDRLALKDTGTLTDVANVTVLITINY